jgi:hypothetical protein
MRFKSYGNGARVAGLILAATLASSIHAAEAVPDILSLPAPAPRWQQKWLQLDHGEFGQFLIQYQVTVDDCINDPSIRFRVSKPSGEYIGFRGRIQILDSDGESVEVNLPALGSYTSCLANKKIEGTYCEADADHLDSKPYTPFHAGVMAKAPRFVAGQVAGLTAEYGRPLFPTPVENPTTAFVDEMNFEHKQAVTGPLPIAQDRDEVTCAAVGTALEARKQQKRRAELDKQLDDELAQLDDDKSIPTTAGPDTIARLERRMKAAARERESLYRRIDDDERETTQQLLKIATAEQQMQSSATVVPGTVSGMGGASDAEFALKFQQQCAAPNQARARNSSGMVGTYRAQLDTCECGLNLLPPNDPHRAQFEECRDSARSAIAKLGNGR